MALRRLLPGLLACALAFAGPAHAASWSRTTIPLGPEFLGDVTCAPGGIHCVTVGGGKQGAVGLWSDDGGTNWNDGAVPAEVQELDGVACVSAERCWAVGIAAGDQKQGAIVTSQDGGRTWTSQDAGGAAAGLRRVSCLGNSCLAVGPNNGQKVFTTHDGGVSWSAVGLPGDEPCSKKGLCFAYFPEDVTFTDASHGFAVGGGRCGGQGVTQCPGHVWRTSDGGASWKVVLAGDTPHFDGISCLDPQRCFAVASTFTTGVVFRTGDGGDTWERQSLPKFHGFFNGVGCTGGGSSVCWAVGQTTSLTPVIMRSVDLGETWIRDSTTSSAGPVYDATATSDGVGLTAGTSRSRKSGMVLRAKAQRIFVGAFRINAAALRRWRGNLAIARYTPQPGDSVKGKDFSAKVDWGDGTTSGATVREVGVGVFDANRGVHAFMVSGDHTFRRVAKKDVIVTVVKRGEFSAAAHVPVHIEPIDPTAFFFPNPDTPTNGDIALLVPQKPSELQRDIDTYDWHFGDGSEVVDSPGNRQHIYDLLDKLDANPGDGDTERSAIRAGILPPGAEGGGFGVGGMSADEVRQVVGVWRAYFPQHAVPHVYPTATKVAVRLDVTDSAGHRAHSSKTVRVSDHCLEWGGPISFIFGHANTCQTSAGFAAVASGPQRRPDYYSFDLGTFEAGAFSAGVSLSVAHNGDVGLSLHGEVGFHKKFKAGLGTDFSLSEGFVGPPNGDPPSDEEIDRFGTGVLIPVGIALGPLGVNLLLNPACGCGGEEYAVRSGWANIGLTLGASCGVNLGYVPGLSNLAPTDSGPWPHNGFEPALHPTEIKAVWDQVMASLQSLQACI
ncbi:MAG: Photosynthesis system assembly factor [Thermoleophilaceae bacterium]|jgi:hypothetical protein|nr:Photosynthesis system assembly factor [Thermoleophilaceae bacterium]